MNQLINVMQQQLKLYTELLELSLASRQIIIDGETAALEGVVQNQRELLARLSDLETRRGECVSNIAGRLNVTPDAVTVSFLLKKLDEPSAAALAKLSKQIIGVTEEIKDSNDVNSKLLETSLSYVDFMMNFATGTSEVSNLYGNAGGIQETAATSLGLFDKQI